MKRSSFVAIPARELACCAALACAIVAAFLLAACSSGASNGTVVEQEYVGDLPVDGAIMQETPNGGYRTVAGSPVIVVNGVVEPESLLPYGGGEEGIRQAEDESPNYQPSL
jgi:hypothetical protein